MVKFPLVFDDVMIKQLQKVAKDHHLKEILTNMLNEIEELGPQAGRLLDSHLFIYEIKNKHPPIRLYFKHNINNNEIYVFEYEMKTSEDKQQKTIQKIKQKIIYLKTKIFSGKLLALTYISFKIK